MDRRRQLRAYEQPPFRAEEWLFYQGYGHWTAGLTPASLIRIRPNGQSDIPEGYRGVLTVLHIASLVFEAPYRFTDVSDGGRYNLRINGVVVPGYARRPVSSRLSHLPVQGIDTTLNEWFSDCWGTYGVIDPAVIVPPRIKSGDVLEIETVAAQAGVVYSILAQGYWWPVADENESGRGNLADPI